MYKHRKGKECYKKHIIVNIYCAFAGKNSKILQDALYINHELLSMSQYSQETENNQPRHFNYILLEKCNVAQLIKPASYKTRNFITLFTTAHL
jgi:hypothetical protein